MPPTGTSNALMGREKLVFKALMSSDTGGVGYVGSFTVRSASISTVVFNPFHVRDHHLFGI